MSENKPNLFVSYSITVKGLPNTRFAWMILDGDLGKIAYRADVATLTEMVQEEALKVFGPGAKSSLIIWRRLET